MHTKGTVSQCKEFDYEKQSTVRRTHRTLIITSNKEAERTTLLSQASTTMSCNNSNPNRQCFALKQTPDVVLQSGVHQTPQLAARKQQVPVFPWRAAVLACANVALTQGTGRRAD